MTAFAGEVTGYCCANTFGKGSVCMICTIWDVNIPREAPVTIASLPSSCLWPDPAERLVDVPLLK